MSTWDGPALYLDGGRRITTHSMLKTMLRCPKQTQYKYAERLKSRFLTTRDKPLQRGTWMHCLLEEYYAGRSWKKKHLELTAKFEELMDDEQLALGDLPNEMLALMRAYLWHYGANKDDPYHGWDVKATELTLECPWPDSEDGSDLYRCRVDILFEDEWGMWIGDHKNHKKMPDMQFRLMDAASALYIWCARQNGYPVQGFVWNYLVTKPPTEPKLAYAGTARERLSTQAIVTDYPTMFRGLKKLGLDPAAYREILKPLRDQRWEYGKVQNSPFFRRDTLEKDDHTLLNVLAAAMRTRDRMHEYDWGAQIGVERTPDRSCTYMCSFTDLCTTELFGGDGKSVRRKLYRVGDPLDYYQEIKVVDQ